MGLVDRQEVSKQGGPSVGYFIHANKHRVHVERNLWGHEIKGGVFASKGREKRKKR
jgi:hypothetical protein